MNRPYKYTIYCTKTGDFEETNIKPSLHHLQTWEPTENPNIKRLVQTKKVYIDTRYKAKLRLFNYLTYTKKGLPVPSFKFTINEPILNF